ncbi:hypothetical protein [Nibribacter koreensis]|uniref:Uncharacterized protein n=1 Tax=Nibribacter koreensis TaxID=1084519 RepID=A0ABP8FYD8_9BACT
MINQERPANCWPFLVKVDAVFGLFSRKQAKNEIAKQCAGDKAVPGLYRKIRSSEERIAASQTPSRLPTDLAQGSLGCAPGAWAGTEQWLGIWQ